jgi:20S proteasome alpha/beta subunit
MARERAMRRILRFSLLVLTIQAGVLLVWARGQQGESPYLRDTTPAQLETTYVHGTIDVVISTREGFVLATDSRATLSAPNGDGSHSDDAQKAFTIGNRAACVIAGLVGSDLQMEGFRLRDAMGTHLVLLDRSTQNSPISATEIAHSFTFGLQSVAGLLTPNTQPRRDLVGAVSAVSVSPDGEPDWITLVLPITLAHAGPANYEYFTVGTPQYFHHSLSIGQRFGVEAIGQPYLVNLLIKANEPLPGIEFSNSAVMKKFYERKKQGHLDEYSLEDAVALAKALVAATIEILPPQAGVGGPIDVLTVTKNGIHWVQRKERSAPFPPPYHVRFFGTRIGGGGQPLDGLECIRCRFHDIEFSYAGDGDVELLAPVIEGHCRLKVLPDARRKMPLVVDRLKRALANKCEIIEERAPVAAKSATRPAK